MRPPRIAILVLTLSASLFLVCRALVSLRRPQPGATSAAAVATTTKASSSSTSSGSPFGSFFSFSTPFNLFPPNAVISLTDDNSTFFPARPAAFGPLFPSRGLSGQLWIGSGFADDNLQEGEGEGELGCSDVAGWEDGRAMKATEQAIAADKAAAAATKAKKHSRRDDALRNAAATTDQLAQGYTPPFDEGTDDYLHEALTQVKRPPHDTATGSGSSHADIQVIQETAEITGKIVLLSRGGCGFLEKVKWAQRRGAVALIVGDNQKGGPLIQMFARGNVDNVTIPSVFTSRTTAHLLSSLMQPGSFIEEGRDRSGNAVHKVQPAEKTKKNKKKAKQEATTPAAAKATPEAKSATKSVLTKDDLVVSERKASVKKTSRRSWLSWLFDWGGSSGLASDRNRIPSSGRLDWVMVDDWSDENDKQLKKSLEKATKKGGESKAATNSNGFHGDDFQIGVEDWRDPDLVGSSEKNAKTSSSHREALDTSMTSTQASPKGGSITPGSGEYVAELVTDVKKSSAPKKAGNSAEPPNGIISKIFGDDDGADFIANDASLSSKKASTPATPASDQDGGEDRHEGLWVTITPTGSASPFFDTLLVLVVSPLITLTVVYALLILRARIRRRRWRAPKSVVDQLPVRTYHTVAASPSHSPRLPSPTSASPTTPLLQGSSRPRPRSRTTTGVPESADVLRVDTALQGSRSSSRGEHEKATGSGNISSEWKKYMGRQVECVVCLEEYVDGVSRVMSLPCGHEFHVECITPWLTTRRRTCPICKGDVVRSLARGSPSSPRWEPYHDDSDEDIEATASGANGPAERDAEADHGVLAPASRSGRRPANDGWFNIIANGLGSGPSFRPRRSDSEEDDGRARSRTRF